MFFFIEFDDFVFGKVVECYFYYFDCVFDDFGLCGDDGLSLLMLKYCCGDFWSVCEMVDLRFEYVDFGLFKLFLDVMF